MKKLFFLLFLIFTTSNAIAEKNSNFDDQIVEKCLAVTELAKSAIGARQNRVPITELYKTIINQESGLRDVAKIVIDSAYRIPIATSDEEAELIKLEYTNNFFNECMSFLSD